MTWPARRCPGVQPWGSVQQMADGCIFCRIVEGTAPASVVYADEAVMAFMDVRPVNVGHVLVIPRLHADRLADLPHDVGAALMPVAQRVVAAMQDSPLRAEGHNLFLADGAVAGQEVFHVHLHVIPRHRDDGMQVRVDYDRAPSRAVLDEQAASIAEGLSA